MLRSLVLFALLFLSLAGPAGAAGAISSTNDVSGGAARAPAKEGASPPAQGSAAQTRQPSQPSQPQPADAGGLFASQDNLVPLPTVIAPVIVKDRLGEHLYLFLAALTATAADAQVVKARLPYVQDAMVREVYLHVVHIDSTDQEPDTAALLDRLKDVINGAVGQPLVTKLQVGRIDTAPF